MTTDEIKAKLDALSPETKAWLHHACDTIADCGEYMPNEVARTECIVAGLVEMSSDNEEMAVRDGVMALVYSGGYLKAAAG